MEPKVSAQNIVKLINLYRSHPILWDMNNKLYRRNDLKAKAYDEISKEFGMSVELVKKKIRSLRATYTGEKRKMMYKKSGSGADESYVPSLLWFSEMSFLDNSIITRKTVDNSGQEHLNLENLEAADEFDFQDSSGSNISNTDATAFKIDKAIEKIMQDKENEFTKFGESIGHQLQNMPIEVGYDLMGEIQVLVTKRKIQNMRNVCSNAAHPQTSTTHIYSSTPCSDIVSQAMDEAEIHFETDTENSIYEYLD